MDLIRFTCCLFTVLQLADISFSKPAKGKVRSPGRHKQEKEKAVYAHLYEDTKNDVNKAIENAILEASKKATDMVLEPKMQSHIVDQMADQMTTEMDNAGSGAADSDLTDRESALEIQTKKHHKVTFGKQPKEATNMKDTGHTAAHQKSTEKEDDSIDTAVVSIEDDDGSSDDAPKGIVQPSKHIKKFKSKEKEADMSVVDATEASAAEPSSKSSPEEEEEKEGDDEDEPEEDKTESKDVLPPITEAKPDASASAPPPVEAKAVEEEGQEDLKQLLDESITNLIKANSAVEVLLRATNERIQAARQPCVKDKLC